MKRQKVCVLWFVFTAAVGSGLEFASFATQLILGCGLLSFERLFAEKLLLGGVVFRCCIFLGWLRGRGRCYGWVDGSVMINMFRKASILGLLKACNDSDKVVESAGDRG